MMPQVAWEDARPKKLLGLELIRFLAAVAVLFWHYQNLWSTPGGLTGFVRGTQPLYRHFHIFYDFGRFGVQVFWSISGYLFFWKYRESVSIRRIGGRSFFVLRFSRLYPLHLATLLLVAVLQRVHVAILGYPFVYGKNDLFHFLLQLFLASDWGFQAGLSFNGPIWSISLEVLVYITFFAVLRYLGSSLIWSVALLLAATASYVFGGHNPTFSCFICFYMSGITATLASTPPAIRYKHALLAVALLLTVAIPVVSGLIPAARSAVITPLLAFAYLPIFIYLLAEHLRLPRIFWRPLETAGNMTYSTYLIHFPVQLVIAIVCAALGLAIPVLSTTFFLAYLGTVMLLGWLIYRFFEMPCQAAIRRRFAHRPL